MPNRKHILFNSALPINVDPSFKNRILAMLNQPMQFVRKKQQPLPQNYSADIELNPIASLKRARPL